MAESKHQQNVAEGIDIDRISSLPDSVLYHILSFLPTRASVATSILSRRWRHLWEHLQVLNFDDNFVHEVEGTNAFRRFAVYVYGVLALRRVRDIRKFRLSCGFSFTNTFYADSLTTWIRSAIGPHLQELQLSLYPRSRFDDGLSFPLPLSLFTCTALVSLSLCGTIRVEQLSLVRLPSLKMLLLNIHLVDSINTLFSACPVLETLNLNFIKWTTSSVPKIHVPSSLKSLTIVKPNDFHIEDLQIDTPSLQYLNISLGGTCSRFLVSNLQNVVEAYLGFYPLDEYIDFVPKLLKQLFRTKFLVLRSSIIKCLLRAPVLDFPEFFYLLHLDLTLPYFNSNFLITLLQKCQMLQVLIIKKKKEASQTQPTSWAQPTSVPNCLVSHLSTIEFRLFQGFADEEAFTAYILQAGLVLKTMTIHTEKSLNLEEKYRILKELSVIARGSTICQLNFD